MSLVGALYVGASGLDAASTELSVVGDNISNSSTVGFKSARTVFADTMAQQLVGTTGQLGVGVSCETVQKVFTQGDFTTTGISTDVAIDGDGLFVVKGNHNGEDGTFYTRNGEFTIDKDGYLTDQEGLKVQGLQADDNGNVTSGLLGDLEVGNASAPAKATDEITIRGNLDQSATTMTWDAANPKTTSNFTTSMTAYDSLGNAIQLNVYFCKDDTSTEGDSGDWTYHVMTDGGNVSQDVSGATTTAGTPAEVASGSLRFDQDGSLISNTSTSSNFCPNNAKSPQELTFNFGTGTGEDPAGTGLDGLTQYSATSAVSFVTQAGSTSGSLSTISIGQDGTITGNFTNGQTRTLGQLVIANFQAPDKLGRVGSTLYTEQPESGSATIGTPATADRGSITSGTLEQSNVDISSEFVRMIAAQRNYEANSKVLTTADSLLSELMQMKR
jgi:flagellar hook protein FlgE